MKRRFLFASILGVTALLSGAAVSLFLSGAIGNVYQIKAEDASFIADKDLPETYKINSSFSAPRGKIAYQGSEYSYNDHYLKYPDGKLYKKDVYTLDVAGQYECSFIYKSGATEISASYLFKVFNDAYTLSNNASYAKYVDEIPTNYNPTPGISVSLAENDMFTFNQPVNISSASLSEPLIVYHPYAYSLRANPANKGKDMTPNKVYDYDDLNKPRPLPMDANCSVVRVTDAYDPSIYFETFIFYRTANTSNNRQQQYAVVGASNQSKVGIEPAAAQGTGARLVTIDGVSYREYIGQTLSGFGITLNTRSGSIFEKRVRADGTTYNSAIGTTFDMSSTADISNADDYGYSIYYDYKTMKVYIKHVSTFWVNDLDEPILHNSNLFPGFTTGEVFISVYNTEYNDTMASFDIESIYGVDDLSVSTIVDDVAPVIKLDNDNNDFNIAVGEPFNLFSAQVIDYNYKGDLTTQVFYEYGSAQEHQVSVVNNSFIPAKPGKYTIVYTAVDAFGNVSKKEVGLYAITTRTSKSIDFEVQELSSVEAGQKIILPTPSVTVYNNDLSISCKAVHEDGSYVDIDTTTWEFFVKKVGEYEIIYDYSDGISSYTYSYKMNVTTSDNVYLEDVSLPKYIIKDASYTLDHAYAVKTNSKELEYVEPDVYVSEDGNGFNKKIDVKNFATSASSSVQFEYRSGTKTIFTSEEIPVKDVSFKSRLNKQLYFDNDNVNVETSSSFMTLSPEVIGRGKTTFINPLNFSNFSLTLDLNGSNLSSCKLNIVLSDYEDETNKYIIGLSKSSDGKTVAISFNNEITYNVNPTSYTISYDSMRETLSDSFDNSVSLSNPFPSDRFYLSMEFVEVNGPSSLALRNLNGQTMNSSLGDNVSPVIDAPHIEGTHSLGSTVDLSFIYPADTLSPYFEGNYYFMVTYYENDEFEDGEAVTSESNVVLDGTQDVNSDYSFVLSKPGVYEIYYSYKDQAGNSSGNSGLRIIYSNDDVAPNITLDDDFSTSTIVMASLNEEHGIKGYKVSDNYDKSINVSIYVLDPDFVYSKLNGNKVALKKKGDYRIYYYATDSTGNMATTYYTVRVK